MEREISKQNKLVMNKVSIYVGTYEKYNNGSLRGEWVDLTDFDSLEDFYTYCAELHKDESDPEFMFQDWEIHEILSDKIGESHIDSDLFDVLEYIETEGVDLDDEDDMMRLHNEACMEFSHHDSEIYGMDFLDEHLSGMKPIDAFQMGVNADINWAADYFVFDGYGNVETVHNVLDHIDGGLISDYLETVV